MPANPSPRVAITGIGVVTPLGSTHAEYWRRLCDGECAIRALDAPYTSDGRVHVAATMSDAAIKALALSPALRRADKLSRMIAAAARDALADARIDTDSVALDRVGIVVGSAVGNLTETDTHLARICTRGPAAASPLLFPNLVLNAPASYASMETGAIGPNLTVSEHEASGEHAVIAGADLIRNGAADVVVAGGGDEVSTIALHVYAEAGALSARAGGRQWSSPYDRERNGVVLGEAAAMVVLEPLGRAVARGAAIHAVIERDILFSVAAPQYAYPLRAGDVATRLRGLLPEGERVELILGCASSSRHLDRLELDALGELLGENAGRTWLSSIKGAVGEQGAAGALNVATAALALRTQTVPPLCNLEAPERPAPFRFAETPGIAATLERVIVHGLARGGAGAALLLRGAGT